MAALDTGGYKALTFTASRYWISNVWGAVVAGLAGGVVMCVIALIIALHTESLNVRLVMAVWVLVLVISVVASFPGNAIARFPYEVAIEKGKGLRLRAPFKRLYIPIRDVRDIKSSAIQGFVVRLNHRHRLLSYIVIHRLFGAQGALLADAIKQEVQSRQP